MGDDADDADDVYDAEMHDGDDCDHDDYEADILTGRATCNMCGHSWLQKADAIQREEDRRREHDRWQTEQDHLALLREARELLERTAMFKAGVVDPDDHLVCDICSSCWPNDERASGHAETCIIERLKAAGA